MSTEDTHNDPLFLTVFSFTVKNSFAVAKETQVHHETCGMKKKTLSKLILLQLLFSNT